MAITTFAANTAGIVYSGEPDDTYVLGVSARVLVSYCQYWTIDFAATGTDCAMDFACGALSSLTVEVSVDGGAFAGVTLPGSTNAFTGTSTYNIFTGLSDASHSVTVRVSGGSTLFFYLNYASAFTVQGSAPAIGYTSLMNGITVYSLADFYGVNGVDGCWLTGLAGGFSYGYQRPASQTAHNPDARVRFHGNPTAIRAFGFLNSGGLKVLQDGTPIGSPVQMSAANSNPSASGSTMGWVQLASGLDGAAHGYEIVACDTGSVMIAQVGLVGGTVDRSTVYPTGGAVGFLGDSITAGVIGTSSDSTLSWASVLAHNKSRPCWNMGISSTYLMAAGSSVPGMDQRYTDLMLAAAVPLDYMVVLAGVNDISTASPPPSTNFQTSYQNLLLRARKFVGTSCKIIAVQILPTTNTNASANRATYNAAIAAAVTAVSDANTSTVSTDTLWGTGGSPPTNTQITNNTADGLHPNATGSQALATYLSPYITTYTGPAAGGGLLRVASLSGGMGG